MHKDVYGLTSRSVKRKKNYIFPTRSRGMRRISCPYFIKTFPAVCAGLMPVPSFVVAAMESTEAMPNSSAAKRSTAVRGASSAMLMTRNGWLRSEVRITRKVTVPPLAAGAA
ncbi:uncharacterized protein Tco025E_04393 [Trypanosoma conorhini]|uniref:Uncharacterized protein n=1 Tax=Trypanosoma conorhini TaxID=83891 RepID=A0A422PM63_9TRYP|nr:uncharacterized protein Tco025E_04393 [Trypanosoma conorhini]RNF18816.1 hypothetical protein Tco025E_04393 [Trypanosoma conorhini]